MPNKELKASDLPKYIVSVHEVETETGLDFLSGIDRDVQQVIEAKQRPAYGIRDLMPISGMGQSIITGGRLLLFIGENAMDGSFKIKNYPILGGYILVNLWLLYLIFWGARPDVGFFKDLQSLLPAGIAATLIAVAFSELISGETKARLVYRRWKYPLPGYRAFSEHTEKDPRIDRKVLEKRYGKLPNKEEAENKLWFKLSKLNEARPSVAYAHRFYLLMRDLAWVTLLQIVIAVAAAIYTNANLEHWIKSVGILLAEFFIAIRTAASFGVEFVRNVLAEESARL